VAALPSGGALVVGGVLDSTGGGGGHQTLLSSAEVYSPNTAGWKPAAPATMARYFTQATALHSGGVLLAGGYVTLSTPAAITAAVEVYFPANNTWSVVASMTFPRYSFGITTLLDGRVLAAGGVAIIGGQRQPSRTAEVYDPLTNVWTSVKEMPDFRYAFALAATPDGGALAVGGSGWNFTPFLATASRYFAGSAPLADRYRCRSNRCTRVGAGSWGVSLSTCKALCRPALFACVSSKCVPSVNGVSAGECKSICKK
jgi:hypothetical protein